MTPTNDNEYAEGINNHPLWVLDRENKSNQWVLLPREVKATSRAGEGEIENNIGKTRYNWMRN